MKLKRYSGNPILSPVKEHEWENLTVCNPGAWYEEGTFYLLYRAAGDDKEHVIRFGLAISHDGFHFERASDEPVFSPSPDGPDSGCVEDPRIVRLDDYFYITYAYRAFPPGRYWEGGNSITAYAPKGCENAPRCIRENITNSGLLMTKDFRDFHRLGRITRANLDDRDVILFPEKVNGKFVMLHRPQEWVGEKYSCEYPSIWISFSDDLLTWEESYLLAKAEFPWERKIGGSTPPIKTEEGWLTLYHGVDEKGIYRVGGMLLDLDDPRKVIARTPDFILEPEEEYEWKGFYSGCVFPTGNVVVGDELFVYYGAADRYCCVATCSVKELLKYVLRYRRKD
ncbi:glycosidase [Candidatus Poribacteria bacterium]|nr:glycosidase [Candidatus Poribacteria bacterium]